LQKRLTDAENFSTVINVNVICSKAGKEIAMAARIKFNFDQVLFCWLRPHYQSHIIRL